MTGVPLLNGLLFAALGIIAYAIAFAILAKAAPVNLWKEVIQERNVAVAILAGAVALGLAWIIAAALH